MNPLGNGSCGSYSLELVARCHSCAKGQLEVVSAGQYCPCLEPRLQTSWAFSILGLADDSCLGRLFSRAETSPSRVRRLTATSVKLREGGAW